MLFRSVVIVIVMVRFIVIVTRLVIIVTGFIIIVTRFRWTVAFAAFGGFTPSVSRRWFATVFVFVISDNLSIEKTATTKLRDEVARLKALFAAGELPAAPGDIHLHAAGGAAKSSTSEQS